jgi:hypothetical protein
MSRQLSRKMLGRPVLAVGEPAAPEGPSMAMTVTIVRGSGFGIRDSSVTREPYGIPGCADGGKLSPKPSAAYGPSPEPRVPDPESRLSV